MTIHDEQFVRDVVSRLRESGLDVWVSGGWAEDFRGIRPVPGNHKDVDLFLRATSFDYADAVIARNSVWTEIPEKRFSHKRAFETAGVKVELVLVAPDTLSTSYFNGRVNITWPDDTFGGAPCGDLPVVSAGALEASRKRYSSTAAAYRAFVRRRSSSCRLTAQPQPKTFGVKSRRSPGFQ